MELLEWCLEAVAPEMAAAREEALELRRAGAGHMELRSLAFRMSQAEDRSRALHRFVLELPGVKRPGEHAAMPLEAAWLGFRILRTALLTSALFPDGPGPENGDRLLLLCGLVLDAPAFGSALQDSSDPGEALAMLGGRAEVAARLHRLLDSRTRPLARLPDANAGRASFQFLTVAAAAEAALALFVDDRAEVAHLEGLLAERGSGVLHLLSMASRADGSVAADENRVIRVIQECLGISEDDGADYRPDPTAQQLRDLFPTEEERAGLVGALAQVIAADGEVVPREEGMCRVVGLALGVPSARVEELLARARAAAESG